MFCPKCGAQNADDAKFCRSCGTDISLVPQAVTGHLAERLAEEEESRGRGGRHRRHLYEKRRPPSIERGVKNFFMGIAFIFIAFSVKTWAPAGGIWWFWMFLPAAAMLAEGVSIFIRIEEDKKKLAQQPYVPAQSAVAPPQRVSALPQRNTGEIIPPPSITEGTTRHLNVPAERKRNDE